MRGGRLICRESSGNEIVETVTDDHPRVVHKILSGLDDKKFLQRVVMCGLFSHQVDSPPPDPHLIQRVP